MNREQREQALRSILKESGEIAKSIETPSIRVLAGAIAFLVVIIDSQSKRLDALEYCKATTAPAMPHVWIDVANQILCKYCSVERA